MFVSEDSLNPHVPPCLFVLSFLLCGDWGRGAAVACGDWPGAQ